MLPEGLACGGVEGDEEGALAGAEIEITDAACEDGRGSIAPDVVLLAEVAVPEFLAF